MQQQPAARWRAPSAFGEAGSDVWVAGFHRLAECGLGLVALVLLKQRRPALKRLCRTRGDLVLLVQGLFRLVGKRLLLVVSAIVQLLLGA